MMNKKRLAALALSAVMATSTMSIPVYAADFSDGATTTEAAPAASAFTSDVEVQTAEPVEEETPDAVGVTEEGDQIKNVKFSYNGPNDYSVTFTIGEGSEIHKEKAEEWKMEAATCVEAEKIWLKFTYDGVTYYSEEGLPTGNPALGDTGHKMEIVEQDYSIKPTHNTEGHVKYVLKCQNPGCDERDGSIETVPKQPHTWRETVYLPDPDSAPDGNANVELDDEKHVVMKDGHAVLKDETLDGYYKAVRYCTDEACEAERIEKDITPTVAEDVTKHVEYAKTAAYAMIVEYDEEHIADSFKKFVNQKIQNYTQDLPIALNDIELKDCTVGGWYKVVRFNGNGDPISDRQTIEVAPHHYHVYTTAEFTSGIDKKQCTVSHDSRGNLVVKNDSCYRPITYYEVSHCQAEGCNFDGHEMGKHPELEVWDSSNSANATTHDNHSMISRVAKTAEPVGDHEYKRDVYDKIAGLKYPTYEKLDNIITAAKAEDYVKISEAPDCTVGGTVTVSYICILDKKTVVTTQDIKLVPTEHVGDTPGNENEIAPTCDKMGSYDAVTYCKYCKTELERRHVQIPRLKHTNEISVNANGIGVNNYNNDVNAYLKFVGDKVVDFNGEAVKGDAKALFHVGEVKGSDKPEDLAKLMYCAGTYATENDKGEFRDAFAVSVKVYTNCDECGHNEVALASQADVKLTVVDVQKEGANGKAGSITLKATYRTSEKKTIEAEYTVPYFSTIEAYNARLEEQPETPGSKINGLHLDSDGVWRYYKDSVLQSDYTGFVDYAGRTFYVINGELDQTLTRLIIFDNEWYYLIEGELTNYTGVVLYDGEWFYVSKGRLDDTINGLVEYNGGLFVFVDGRLADEGNGMWISNDNKAYWLALGRVCEEYTGVAMYNNAFFYVIDGKVAQDYNGTVEYNGATFRVENGQLYGPIK